MEKWVNRPNISINEKNLQNLGLKGIRLNPTILNDFFIISKRALDVTVV